MCDCDIFCAESMLGSREKKTITSTNEIKDGMPTGTV